MVTLGFGGAPRQRTSGAVHVATIASAISAVAVAAWLLPASVMIVTWPGSGPDRAAYFAPLFTLWWALTAAAIVWVVAVAWAARRRTLEEVADVLSPLQWLWLWTVPFWPIVPDRLPLLLALGGSLRAVIAVAAGAAAVVRVWRLRHWTVAIPRAGRLTVFVVSLALYLTSGLAWNREAGLGGDEPHYLVITQSLLLDHDLDIENNHARRDYAPFYQGTLRPDYLARGRHGEIYSIHAPGVSALVLPAYAMAGARGAVMFMALIAALAALAVFDTALLLGGRTAAWLTWAAVCLTVPFLPHAWLIYPEMAAALVVAWAVRWIVAPDVSSIFRWVGRGVALATLPWLHTKYAILLAPLVLFVAADTWRRAPGRDGLRRVVAFALPIAAALAAWFGSFHVMYGVLDPLAPYGSYTAMFVRTTNIARGVLGLAIDQKFGLLVYAPVYVLAFAGAIAIVRRPERRLLAATILTTTGLFVASTARFYMWWGGSSAPGRFLVPILPLVAPLVTAAVLTWRRLTVVTLSVSVAIALAAAAMPSEGWLFSAPHGTSRLMSALQGAGPVTAAWPTFTEPEWRPQLGRAVRALIGRFPAAARDETVERGREALLGEYDNGRLRAFDYRTRAKVGEAFVLANGSLHRARRDDELNEDPARLAGPFDLPAGDYVVSVWFAGEPAQVLVRFQRGPAIWEFDVAQGMQSVGGALHLPVDARVIWVGAADSASAARVERVEIVPLSVVPRSDRPDVDPIAIERLERGGLLVYGDPDSYPENGVFWTRGTRRAHVYVAPAGATRLTATLHMGPHAGTAHITVGGEARDIPVPAGGSVDVSFPVRPGIDVVPIAIEASDSFVPAKTDPHSDDTRRLGCQVRIRLS